MFYPDALSYLPLTIVLVSPVCPAYFLPHYANIGFINHLSCLSPLQYYFIISHPFVSNFFIGHFPFSFPQPQSILLLDSYLLLIQLKQFSKIFLLCDCITSLTTAKQVKPQMATVNQSARRSSHLRCIFPALNRQD